MRSIQLAILAICTLSFGTVAAQENAAPKTPPAKIDYSILGQPGPAAKVGLSDEQRAAIARILDIRVNDLVAAEPKDREAIVSKSNAEIEALLSDAQKEILAESLQGGKLQFNFFKQKWSAVLKWFAEQANLSLVMDAEPPGLFTYNDTREFTPSEAIDLLNSVLLSKNFTLIRRERMLVVVDTSAGVPYDLVQQVPLEKLSDFGRFEIVTTEFPLGGRPLAAVVEAVTPLVGTHGKVIPLAAADKLLVTETAGRLKAINFVIAAVPVPKKPAPPPKPKPPIPPVFKTYPAPGLDPVATTEILTTLFPTATIKFDPNANVVHCNAIPEIQTGVEASVAKLVESVSGDNRPRMKAYRVPAKQLTTLVDQITLAHPTLPIDSDPENNRLLIVASSSDHDEVAKTLQSLGAMTTGEPSGAEPTKLVVYPVDVESVAITTSLLEEILPGANVISDVNRIAVRGTEADQETAKNTINQFAKSVADQPSLSFYPLDYPLNTEMMAVLTAAVPEATISWLGESKKLSVLATLKDHQRVSETLAQIKEVTAAPQEKTVAYYPVTAYQRSRFQLIQAELPGELPTMLLMTDATPDEFIAWGTESQHKQLAALLETLKQNEPASIAAPQKLDVTVAAPADLVTSLQSRFPGVEMVFNEYANALYVWADGEKFESIRNAFQTISATMAPREESVMIPYALINADADAVLTLLMGMRPELNAAADTNSNRILVSAPLAEQSRYKVLIEQLDMKPNQPNEPQIQSYSLKAIDTATAITILTPLFPELTFGSDPANKRLIATGSAPNQLRLATAIERIDVPKADQDLRLETYALDGADASQVISVLAQLAPTAIASSSADGQQLFVWGDQAAHQTVKQAMAHLTATDSKTSRSMKTYRLPKSASTTAVSILQPVAADASLSLDATNENLIAWATAEEHQAIATALDGLNQGLSETKDESTEVYRFTRSTPAVAYSILGTLVPDAKMVVDSTASVLAVTATSQDHETIKTVIAQIEDDPDNVRSLKTYPIPKGAGSTAVTILQPVASDATLTLDANYENLIAWATAAEHQAIATAVEGLHKGLKKPAAKSTEVYRFQKSTPSVAYSVLTTLVPGATMAVDSTASVLVATASADDHAKIKTVISRLEDNPEAVRSMKAYPIPKVAGPTAVSIMQPVADGASLSLDASYENLIAWATDEEHQAIAKAVEGLLQDLVVSKEKSTEVYRFLQSTPQAAYTVLTTLVPDATMAVDEATSVLVATATAEEHEMIQSVVTQIEDDPKSIRTMKAYPLPKGAIGTATTIMQPVAMEATLSLDATSENLIAFATEDEHKAIAAAVEGLRNDLVNANDKSTEVYRFLKSTPQAAYTVLTTLIPDATMAVDEATSVLVATASAEQHEMIRAVVAQIEDDPESTRKMKAYPLPRSAAATAVTIMQPVAADATFSLDETQENLIVWATEAEHQTIAEAVESLRKDLVNRNGDDQTVAVYALDPELVSAASLVESFDEAMIDQLSVLPNVQTNSLIVHGNREAQAKFAETIETITSQLKKTNEVQTHVYRFTKAAPTVALQALTSLLPDATFAIDEETSVLVATATARQHESIAAVVQQIDTEESNGDQSTRVYRLHRASARTVSDAFEMLTPKARIGFDRGSNVVIATASREDHAILKDAVAQVEGRASGGAVRVFRLTKVQANIAATAMQAVIDAQSIEADVQANEEDNSLVVVAAPEQMKMLEDAIEQIDSDNRRFEVFEIVNNDPFQAERSARDMFNNMPERARPHIGVDFNGGKLFIRGTQDQVEQVRLLLTKMGEPLVDRSSEQANRNKRTIRFRGNPGQAIEQVKTIWPQLRGNPIQVIVPSNRAIQPIVPGGELPAVEPTQAAPDEDTQSSIHGSFAPRQRNAIDYAAGYRSNSPRSAELRGNGTRLVVFQNTTRAPKPNGDGEQREVKSDNQESETEADEKDLSPILMIADGDNITIASDDTEALDRLESLLKVMAGEGHQYHQSDFAIFLLRNTGATDTKELLAELIEELPFHIRGGIREVVVVADDRLNALVVYGNRQAREMVGQLLEVLDSQGLPDPLNVYKSEIFQFQHIHVSRAMAILRNVYKPQLSPGMGKKPIEIPEGVTTSVASILTQINASNRGPILTLDMDATTNSMIMRAPPELREEIKKFAMELDEQGANNNNRSVRVIQLRQGKSKIIQEALQQFIGNQPIAPSSGAVPSPAAASAAAP
jgi:type II secretory pathway component GspD/PulD (secretin)